MEPGLEESVLQREAMAITQDVRYTSDLIRLLREGDVEIKIVLTPVGEDAIEPMTIDASLVFSAFPKISGYQDLLQKLVAIAAMDAVVGFRAKHETAIRAARVQLDSSRSE